MFRRLITMATVVLLVVIGLLFTALNPQRFDIDLGVARVGVSAGLALLVAFAAGLLAGAAWRSNWIARLLAERGRLRHALRLAESRPTDASAAGVKPAAAAPPADVA
jgi:putative membrane protein